MPNTPTSNDSLKRLREIREAVRSALVKMGARQISPIVFVLEDAKSAATYAFIVADCAVIRLLHALDAAPSSGEGRNVLPLWREQSICWFSSMGIVEGRITGWRAW